MSSVPCRATIGADHGRLPQIVSIFVLLASPLDALKTLERAEDVDLLALAAEEASRVAAAGSP